MESSRKITVIIPNKLIERAIKASGEGLTPTIRRGLELVAAKDAYSAIQALQGKYKKRGLGATLDELRQERVHEKFQGKLQEKKK